MTEPDPLVAEPGSEGQIRIAGGGRRWSIGASKRGLATLIGGTTLSQVLIVASSPILTRLYTPDDVGAWSAAVAIMAILISVACLSYQLAIALPADDASAANVLGLCIVVAAVTSLLASMVLFVGGDRLFEFLGIEAVAGYWWLIIIGQFFGATFAAFTMWAVRTRRYRHIASGSLVQSASVATTQIALGAVDPTATGMLAGSVTGSIAGSGLLALNSWRSHRQELLAITVSGMRTVARRYVRFVKFSTPAAFLNTLGLRAPQLLLVLLYGPAVGGFFALANRLVSIPLTTIAGAVGQMYFAHAAPLARSDIPALRDLYVRTTRTLALVSIVPTIIGMIVAPAVFRVFFGAEWEEAGWYVTVLAPWYCVMFIVTPAGSTLDVMERQDLHFIREGGRLAILGCAAAGMVLADLSAFQAVIALSVAGTVFYSWYGVLSWRATIERHPPTSGPRG